MAYKESLTEEERLWVIALENEMRKYNNNKKEEQFGKVTEFDIALHAIIAKDEPQKAIKRLRRLKQFKDRYGVREDNTVYEAIKIVHAFVHRYPNFLQAFNQDKFGRWVIFFQLNGLVYNSQLQQPQSTTSPTKSSPTKLSPSKTIKTPTTVVPSSASTSPDDRFIALYYIFHALQPDLDSVRNGTVWIGDFQNITKTDLFGMINGGRALCRDAYPIKVKDFPCLNAPPVLSAAYGVCRPFLSSRVKEVMAMHCTVPMVQQHFSKHLLSKPLGGTQKPADILDILEENIKRRFENEELFRLKHLVSSKVT